MARRLIPASDHPTAAATVAGWLVTEWAHLYPDWDLSAATAELLAVGPGGEPPITWLLFDDDISDRDADAQDAEMQVIGSVGLALDGELGDPVGADEPVSGIWLVNLFVTPSARRRGHGSALLDHAITSARDLGIGDLLLTTEHSTAHYRSKGWNEIGATSLNGHDSIIMSLASVTR